MDRTVASTVATGLVVPDRQTVLFDPDRMTDVNGRLVCHGDRADGSRGTYLRTLHTFGTAIALLIGYFRLHEGR